MNTNYSWNIYSTWMRRIDEPLKAEYNFIGSEWNEFLYLIPNYRHYGLSYSLSNANGRRSISTFTSLPSTVACQALHSGDRYCFFPYHCRKHFLLFTKHFPWLHNVNNLHNNIITELNYSCQYTCTEDKGWIDSSSVMSNTYTFEQ